MTLPRLGEAGDEHDPRQLVQQWIVESMTWERHRTHPYREELLAAEVFLGSSLPVMEALAEVHGSEDLARRLRPVGGQWGDTKQAALELLTLIDQRDLIDSIRAGGGPVLSAERLHADVWEAARRPWQAKLHRMAVAQAGTAVDTLLQLKVGRQDKSGTPLISQSFSLLPATVDQPRLRLPDVGARGDESWTRAHEGAMYFGMGCILGIRNWAAHTLDEADEQVALEYLAALSVMARWIDRAEVERATDSGGDA